MRDTEGYATIVVMNGVKQPADATAANGCTSVDLSGCPSSDFGSINIRDILLASGFAGVANQMLGGEFGGDFA